MSSTFTSPPMPPSDTASADDAVDPNLLQKVRALLAQAESTTFPDEADTFTAKAQQLMARYRIDRALLDGPLIDATGPQRRSLTIDNPYTRAKAMLYHRVAQANGCEAVFSGDSTAVDMFGGPDDLVLVETLVTSLLVQATVAVQAAGPQRDSFGRSTTRSFRRSFYLAYAHRIGERLADTVEQTVAELDDDDRSRALPVLASREAAVREAVTRAFPYVRSKSTVASNRAGWHAGRQAAESADLSVGPAVDQ